MVPKKIHYCWFGGKSKPKIFYKCISSWKRYFPDFEIIEWNEDNFDINCNSYVKEAYEEKKYAFVSDYARLKILYEEGGIYFDTDVEVLKRIDDDILEHGYLAEEKEGRINTGLGFCTFPKNKAIKLLLNSYTDIHFKDEDGILDTTPCTKRNSKTLVDNNYNLTSDDAEIEGMRVYDREYFCGFDVDNNNYIITDKTYTVHHYDATWFTKREKFISNLKRLTSKIIGINNYNRLRLLKLRRKNEKK